MTKTRVAIACVLFAMLLPPASYQASSGSVSAPAKTVFGGMKTPAPLKPSSIGYYARGCLAGASALPVTGDAWQVMRLSRNRNWGHPQLIALLEKLAEDAKSKDGWNGLLVGDISQPRGGPMSSGHASHQVGLDADIWLTPMPDHVLSPEEREAMVPKNMVVDHRTLNRKNWTEAQAMLIKRAASYPEVERIFVHPPIKKALCQWATGDRSWLAKVRPYYNHTYHFHLRIKCPKDSISCKEQPPPSPADGTGCGDELAYWFSEKPWLPAKPPVKPPPPLKVSDLPVGCRQLISIK